MAWAVGDLVRRPVRSALLFLSVMLLTMLIALVLLLQDALVRTSNDLIGSTPAIVVRRVSAGGWMPLPLEPALEKARRVPGCLNPRGRIWGVANSSGRPVTVVGLTAEKQRHDLPAAHALARRGTALAGTGVAADPSRTDIALTAARTLVLTLSGRLPERSCLATHDVVVMHPEDARALLDLPPGHVSDLAADVFHDEEIEAVAADLSRAFPWPVHVSTRLQNARQARAAIERTAGIGLFMCLPALLALAFLAAAVGLESRNRRFQVGLFKSLGWTSGDLLRLDLQGYLLAGAAAMAAGLTAAYLMLYLPGISWPLRLLTGWTQAPPNFSPAGTFPLGPLALTLVLVGLPYATAAFWASWNSVRGEPADLLEG